MTGWREVCMHGWIERVRVLLTWKLVRKWKNSATTAVYHEHSELRALLHPLTWRIKLILKHFDLTSICIFTLSSIWIYCLFRVCGLLSCIKRINNFQLSFNNERIKNVLYVFWRFTVNYIKAIRASKYN